jgi:hypothetical protein
LNASVFIRGYPCSSSSRLAVPPAVTRFGGWRF